MAAYPSMVVTDGRVMLGSDVEPQGDLAVIPRTILLGSETLSSAERANTIRALAHASRNQSRQPRIAPPEREHFLTAYQQAADGEAQVVSIHLHSSLDGAAREARICRRLFQPRVQIHIYEAKTLEGGLAFLLSTAVELAQEGATATQLLALLRYLEGHMHTLLLTRGAVRAQHLMAPTALQQLRGAVPGTETLWWLDPKAQALDVIEQGRGLSARIGAIVQGRWGSLQANALVRHRGYAKADVDALVAGLKASGRVAEIALEPVTATFIPGLPVAFVELLLLPTEDDRRRLRGLVQNPIWWKGTA